MNSVHKNLAAGRWQTLSLAQQMGNIGSEISRANKWRTKDAKIFRNAILRAYELLNLTVADKRWTAGLKELTRVREVLSDSIFGTQEYNTSPKDLIRYFDQFALSIKK